MSPFLNYIISHAKPFWLQLFYFLFLSAIGYLALKASEPRTEQNPNDLNLFFTSVSALTVSSMSTVEMEVFSNSQLIIITFLMLLGGDVLVSFFSLFIERFKYLYKQNKINIDNNKDNNFIVVNSIELGSINFNTNWDNHNNKSSLALESFNNSDQEGQLKYNCLKTLGYVVLGYHVIIHAIGIILVTMYISLTPSAKHVLESKGLVLQTFSFFVIISTFSNCGYIPTNENMIVFRKNSGLLLILIPQIFLGNTLFSPCLRLVIWVLERFTKKKEYNYMLNNYKEMGFDGLMCSKKSWFLVGSVFGLYMLQIVVFSGMEWSSGVMEEMGWYEKFVGSLFQTANSRHSGESIVDLSMVSSAILVVFIIMMYLPPCFSYLPIGYQQKEKTDDNDKTKLEGKKNIIKNMVFSQLSYLSIFVIVICITERKSLKQDPLNFNVLNIVFEVISAYGNVGFSTGYSCERRLKTKEFCEDKMYGFVGKWSNGGKAMLILVMLFGRLKKFNLHGGKAWIPLS
ncbi:unnamed protein product [Amaranthus hypochondriacus]